MVDDNDSNIFSLQLATVLESLGEVKMLIPEGSASSASTFLLSAILFLPEAMNLNKRVNGFVWRGRISESAGLLDQNMGDILPFFELHAGKGFLLFRRRLLFLLIHIILFMNKVGRWILGEEADGYGWSIRGNQLGKSS